MDCSPGPAHTAASQRFVGSPVLGLSSHRMERACDVKRRAYEPSTQEAGEPHCDFCWEQERLERDREVARVVKGVTDWFPTERCVEVSKMFPFPCASILPFS